MGTELEVLAIGNYVLHKADQNETLKKIMRNVMSWTKAEKKLITTVIVFILSL